ncbi:hypothetical protein ACF0H5_022484 [Mactra antiquata]
MSQRLKIALVLSSTREGRLNDQVARLVRNQIGQEHDVDILDPKCLETTDTQQSVNFLYNPGAVPQNIVDYNEKLKTFDAFLFVCAEYNFSIPPGLTNMFDNFPPPTFMWKPCAMVNYSINPLGGSRSAIQLLTYTHGLGMMPVPKQVAIPKAHEVVDKDGNTMDENLVEEIQLLLQHLYWAANALKRHKAVVPGPHWAPS